MHMSLVCPECPCMTFQGEEKARRALALYAKAASTLGLPEDVREDFSARAAVSADLYGAASMVEAAERLHAARYKPTEKLGKPTAAMAGQKRAAEPAAAHESPASKQPRPQEPAATAAPPVAAPAQAVLPGQAVPPAPVPAAVASAPAYYPLAAAAYTYPPYYPGYQYPAYSYPQY